MSKPGKASPPPRIANRKASHDYHVLDKLECGIVLRGSEVKSVRAGQVSLQQGYARVEERDMGLYLLDVDIAPYAQATGPNGHEPKAKRKLLAHRRQIEKLFTQTSSKGATLIPLAMYFVRGMVKVEIGVCQGKRSHDKREDLKQRDAAREMRQAMSRRRI